MKFGEKMLFALKFGQKMHDIHKLGEKMKDLNHNPHNYPQFLEEVDKKIISPLQKR